MRYSSISVKNFRCFKGSTKKTIEFPSEGVLYIVHAVNGSGKSSLLHAFRFGLYGRSRDPDTDTYIPYEDLVNHEQGRKGNWSAEVEIKFSHEDVQYKLIRRIENRISKPTKDDDFDVTLELLAGSTQSSGQTAEKTIRDLLDEDVSNFFIMDMEDIVEVQRSLGKESSREATREKIEKAIGIHFLTSVNEFLHDESEKAIKKRVQNDESLKKYEKDLKKLEDLTEKKEKLMLKKQERVKIKEESLSQLKEVEKRWKAESPLQDLVQDLNRFIEEKEFNQKIITDLTTEISTYIEKNTWFVVEDVIQGMWKKTMEVYTLATAHEQSTARLEKEIDSIKKEIKGEVCARCNQKVEPKHLKKLDLDLANKEKELEKNKNKDVPVASKLKPTIDNFGEYGEKDGYIKKIVLERIKSYYSAVVEVEGIDSRINEIEKKLKGEKTGDFGKLTTERDELLLDIEKQTEGIEATESAIKQHQLDIGRIRDKLSDSPGMNDQNSESLIASGLSSIFDEVSNNMAKQSREHIDIYVKEVFKSLINEPDFYDIEVGPEYLTKMTDNTKGSIGNKSKGQARIASVSLLAALSHQSINKAPVIIDSPMAGLDGIHWVNLYKFTKDLSNQVILFATDREFSEKIRPTINNFLSGETTIENAGADNAKFHDGRVIKYLSEMGS